IRDRNVTGVQTCALPICTDVAIEAADITLVRAEMSAVVDSIRLSRKTLRTIKMNLFWAFAYNVAAIPLDAFGLLNPMLAGAAMELGRASCREGGSDAGAG